MPVPHDELLELLVRRRARACVYLALLGPGVHRLAGHSAEDLRARETIAPCGGASACNALGLLLYAIVPVVLGHDCARCASPRCESPDLALPMILMHGLPLAVGTLGLAAVFSAELSAADAVLFMLTTSLSQDLYKRFVNRRRRRAAGAARGPR